MTNLDSILKSRDITLPTKVCQVKAMVFPVVMYGCQSWTIKKTERQRIDTFELWCWRRLLRVPWTARRSNQSILKENQSWLLIGRTDVEAENANTLSTWCEELCHLKRPWCWERLKARREGDDRRWDGWMVSLTRWTWVWASSGHWWSTGKHGVLQSIGSQSNMTEQLHWTEPMQTHSKHYFNGEKKERVSSKIRNITIVSFLPSVIHYSFWSPSHDHHRKKKERKK